MFPWNLLPARKVKALDLQDKLRRMHKKTAPSKKGDKNLPDLSRFLGGEEVSGPEGSFWRVTRDFSPELRHGRYCLGDISGFDSSRINLWEKGHRRKFNPSDLVFLDTETTGLAGGTGTVAFLVGMGWWQGDAFRLEQFLMRDFPEEPAMLQDLANLLEPKKILITFNGRSFDWPLLQTRFTLSRKNREIPAWEEHWDLLFWARRLWRKKLVSCSLNSLERNILDFHREGDIPGWEIPQRYFDFLRTGRGNLLQDICEHNVWDILSMVGILLHLCGENYKAPERIQCPHEAIALGRLQEKSDRGKPPENYYLQAVSIGGEKARKEALQNLAFYYKKNREWEKALQAWTELVEIDDNAIQARVELAKIYEHRLPNLPKALQITSQALILAWQQEKKREAGELEHRRKRLERKIKKSSLKGTGFSADN